MEKTSYLEDVLFTDNLPVRVNTYTRNMTAVIQNHYHGELEFNLLYEPGSIDFYVNGERHTIHTGEVGIINSYDIHSSIPSLRQKVMRLQASRSLFRGIFSSSCTETTADTGRSGFLFRMRRPMIEYGMP